MNKEVADKLKARAESIVAWFPEPVHVPGSTLSPTRQVFKSLEITFKEGEREGYDTAIDLAEHQLNAPNKVEDRLRQRTISILALTMYAANSQNPQYDKILRLLETSYKEGSLAGYTVKTELPKSVGDWLEARAQSIKAFFSGDLSMPTPLYALEMTYKEGKRDGISEAVDTVESSEHMQQTFNQQAREFCEGAHIRQSMGPNTPAALIGMIELRLRQAHEDGQMRERTNWDAARGKAEYKKGYKAGEEHERISWEETRGKLERAKGYAAAKEEFFTNRGKPNLEERASLLHTKIMQAESTKEGVDLLKEEFERWHSSGCLSGECDVLGLDADVRSNIETRAVRVFDIMTQAATRPDSIEMLEEELERWHKAGYRLGEHETSEHYESAGATVYPPNVNDAARVLMSSITELTGQDRQFNRMEQALGEQFIRGYNKGMGEQENVADIFRYPKKIADMARVLHEQLLKTGATEKRVLYISQAMREKFGEGFQAAEVAYTEEIVAVREQTQVERVIAILLSRCEDPEVSISDLGALTKAVERLFDIEL